MLSFVRRVGHVGVTYLRKDWQPTGELTTLTVTA